MLQRDKGSKQYNRNTTEEPWEEANKHYSKEGLNRGESQKTILEKEYVLRDADENGNMHNNRKGFKERTGEL